MEDLLDQKSAALISLQRMALEHAQTPEMKARSLQTSYRFTLPPAASQQRTVFDAQGVKARCITGSHSMQCLCMFEARSISGSDSMPCLCLIDPQRQVCARVYSWFRLYAPSMAPPAIHALYHALKWCPTAGYWFSACWFSVCLVNIGADCMARL